MYANGLGVAQNAAEVERLAKKWMGKHDRAD